jgi:pSer/pThr/pTyr-binding forkhead associated (FHA) protein
VAPWLRTDVALRLPLLPLWKARAADPSFRAAAKAELARHPEWEPFADPEGYARRMAQEAERRRAREASRRAGGAVIALRVTRPPGATEPDAMALPMQREGLTIGRSTECDLVLADPLRLVSRQQAQVNVVGQAARVRCISSTTPLWVNGVQLDPAAERAVLVGTACASAASRSPSSPWRQRLRRPRAWIAGSTRKARPIRSRPNRRCPHWHRFLGRQSPARWCRGRRAGTSFAPVRPRRRLRLRSRRYRRRGRPSRPRRCGRQPPRSSLPATRHRRRHCCKRWRQRRPRELYACRST